VSAWDLISRELTVTGVLSHPMADSLMRSHCSADGSVRRTSRGWSHAA